MKVEILTFGYFFVFLLYKNEGAMTKIILSNDVLKIEVLPEFGACLSFMQYKKNGAYIHLLRPLEEPQKNEALHSALFPVLPFCHRIKGGEFTYWGITRRMKKNKTGEADPIHGDGWSNAWEVENKSPTSVLLKLIHDKNAGGFPFSYTAFVEYTLVDNMLEVAIRIKNDAVVPMPCGMGIRPFFKKTQDTTLKFNAQEIWANGKDPILGRPYAIPKHWAFDEARTLEKKGFDTCFGGFDGQAEIRYPEENIKIMMEADYQFCHVALESSSRKNYFCLEPSTNTEDAFNLAFSGIVGTGIKSIGPFEEVSSKVSLKVEDL